ncbi:MAG: DUF4833 domain-containing protein [Polyangiaceae bacterium]
MSRTLIVALVAASMAGIATTPDARADEATPEAGTALPRRDLPSVFFVSKNENKNEVHYGLHLDAKCRPVGKAPLFAYWRMKEKGPAVTEPLLTRELAGYGLGAQRVESREDASLVTFTVRALPERPILLEVKEIDGTCSATPWIVIGEGTAHLANIHVNVSWPFGIGSVVLRGTKKGDGTNVSETIAK